MQPLQACIFTKSFPHSLLPIRSFIHSDYFYSTSSSPLLLRGAPDTARILCRSLTLKRHRQLRVKDLPKDFPWWPECDWTSESCADGRAIGIRDPSNEKRQIYQLANTPHELNLQYNRDLKVHLALASCVKCHFEKIICHLVFMNCRTGT